MRITLFIVFILIQCHLLAQTNNDRKFYNLTEIGYGIGVGSVRFEKINNKTKYEGRFFRLRTQFAYRLTDHFDLGLGFGLDGYHNFTANTAPLFIASRYSFKQSSLISTINVGYSIPLASNFERGLMGSLGIGKKVTLGKLKLLPSIAFNAQALNNISYFIIDNNSQIIFLEDTLVLKSVALNLGIIF